MRIGSSSHARVRSMRGWAAAVASVIVVTGVALLPSASGATGNSGPSADAILSGKNVCHATGSINFSPPLRVAGAAHSGTESPKYSLRLTSCNHPGATSGTIAEAQVAAYTSNRCLDLAVSHASGGGVDWAPDANTSSGFHFTGFSEATSPGVSFTLTGGSSSAGSFDGTAKATLPVTETKNQIAELCASRGGLSTLEVSGGTFEIGQLG